MDTKKILKDLEETESTLAVSLINGNKSPQKLFGTQIAHDMIPVFYNIFESNSEKKDLILIIRSNGGVLEAPLPLINLIREYFDSFKVYIPENAHSAATLIAIGADEIHMTEVASLSPVDPQININLNNNAEGDKNSQFQFSVEDIAGYYNLLNKLRITDTDRVRALEYLTSTLSPPLLGKIERVRELIHIIVDKILRFEQIEETKKEIIIKKLAEDIPSHNYWISRCEAIEMGLPVQKMERNRHDLLKNLMKEYKIILSENESELIVNIPDEKGSIEKTFDRAIIQTKDNLYTFQTKYIFHRNGKVDQSINEWRIKE